MSNFFYTNSHYSLFQKAMKHTSGEDVVVDILSTDDSLKEDEVVANKHVIRKDNRFNQESSFNKFFGPRRSLNRNFDMKDFSSWRNKNYREAEKQIDKSGNDKKRFSFADFMNERSGGRVYNDVDENKRSESKAINELPTEDPTFKRFSLNDYMRRLEEQTRVKSETHENEDLIDSIGNLTQEVKPDSTQDENFDEGISNINVEGFVDDEDFAGDKFAVDTSELDAMKEKLEQIKSQTEEINQLIDEEPEEVPEFNFEKNVDDDVINEDLDDEEQLDFEEIEEQTEEEIDDIDKDSENKLDETVDENKEESDESNSDIINEENKGELTEEEDDKKDKTENKNKTETDSNSVIHVNINDSSADEKIEKNHDEENSQKAPFTQINILEPKTGRHEKVDGTTSYGGGNVSTQDGDIGGDADVNVGAVGILTTEQHDKSQEIIGLIDKNEKERKEIEEKLKQAEKDKLVAKESYENRLKELEKSIEEKDKEAQKKALQEKIKNDNLLSEMKAEFKLRESEIRRLEKEAALKLKIGALLKKELKNNLSISNLEMNNKLLEITSQINQEKQKAKANKPKTTRKRKTKRKIDSDIIGGIDFD